MDRNRRSFKSEGQKEKIRMKHKKWILLDCNYLCHRAKHAIGSLSHNGTATGVVYGFLRELPFFQERFDTHRLVFCWDSKTSKRKQMCPEYKANRAERIKKMTPEELVFEDDFRYQMQQLRRRYLKLIGFKNVFCQKGYEADDIIASICKSVHERNLKNRRRDDKVIIVSSDQDLYQCLSWNVTIYDPHRNKTMTRQKFITKYGIKPHEWAMMKAIAGCLGDNVKGVKGVGENTALKYLRGELNENSKKFLNIVCEEGTHIYASNKCLVKLPMKGTKKFELKKDKISEEGWKTVVKELGMKSIREKIPFGVGR